MKDFIEMSPEANHNTKVFISYAQEDIEAAQRLYLNLKDSGLEPWLDRIKLLPGQRWKPAIKEAIQNSRYFIALFSSNSVEARGFVQKQLKEALDILDEFPSEDIFIIPARLDDCKVSEDKVNELYMVDLFRDWGSGIEKILKAMNVDSSIKRKDDGNHYASKDDKFTINPVYWNSLLTLIDQQKCVPFIGPNAYSFVGDDGQPWIPSNIEIAKEWIKEHGYPFGGSDLSEKCIEEMGFSLDGSYQLARVAQFLTIDKNDEMFPKLILRDYLSKRESPDFSLPQYENTPYAFLAGLDLKIYVTTNYDLLMENALICKGKEPVSEFCRWNDKLLEIPSRIGRHSRYKPDKDKPLVFHLQGDINTPESMVLTEKDYFDFIINLNKEDEKELLPNIIRQELPLSSLLFIGYTLQDINFRTIFQGALSLLGRKPSATSLAVQIPPIIDNDRKKNLVLNYLNQYTKKIFEVYAYWGNVTNFVAEFRERWEKYERDKKSRVMPGVRIR
ncbi:MAG: TIR domain-containing protein [Candidatus Nitrosopolaris sp.]